MNYNLTKGEVLLSLMNDDQIQSVVETVRGYGSSTPIHIDRLRRDCIMPARWFDLIDNGTATADELNAILHGLTLVFFSAANTAWDEKAYVDLLVKSIGMSEKQAQKVAKSIDTEDVFSYKDASWTDRFKRLYNWIVPEAFEAEYASAKMDLDLPWEMLQLGQAIINFLRSTKFSRNRFLSALTTVNVSSGDISDYNSVLAARVLPLAVKLQKDPAYGDIFDSILLVVKMATNVFPVGNVIRNITDVVFNVLGLLIGSSSSSASTSAQSVADKSKVVPEIKTIGSTNSSSADAIPLVYLKRDTYGPVPVS